MRQNKIFISISHHLACERKFTVDHVGIDYPIMRKPPQLAMNISSASLRTSRYIHVGANAVVRIHMVREIFP